VIILLKRSLVFKDLEHTVFVLPMHSMQCLLDFKTKPKFLTRRLVPVHTNLLPGRTSNSGKKYWEAIIFHLTNYTQVQSSSTAQQVCFHSLVLQKQHFQVVPLPAAKLRLLLEQPEHNPVLRFPPSYVVNHKS